MSQSLFAICTFRDTGPLKTWSAVESANVHNARTKPLAHAMPGAAKPLHLVGTGHLATDIKTAMRRLGIDSKRLQKNGVIAYEAVLTASPLFFSQGTEEQRQLRLDSWVAAQKEWAVERYGALRVVSMVLHLDEKEPHVHLIICPFEAKPDARFKDKAKVRWRLVGRMISSPGRFDEIQDQYAAAMSSFGLVRGVKGSGAKHEPVPVYLKRMAAKEQELDDNREAFNRDRAELNAKITVEEGRIAALHKEAERHLAAAAQKLREAGATSDRINGHWSKLKRVFKIAAEFERRVDALGGARLTPGAASAMDALLELGREGIAVQAPAGEARPNVLAVYTGIQREAGYIAQRLPGASR